MWSTFAEIGQNWVSAQHLAMTIINVGVCVIIILQSWTLLVLAAVAGLAACRIVKKNNITQ